MTEVHPVADSLVIAVMRETGVLSLDQLRTPVAALSIAAVRDRVTAAGLVLPERILTSAVAAIRANKHIMLRGAPGTGKTTFALALAQAAADVGLCGEPMLSTGTADWTSADTVGAYRMRRDQQLEFREGHVLSAIRDDRWLVIDELNRADIDKAIGQLFTVLSGHPVTLPFEVNPADGDENAAAGAALPDVPRHVSVVPPGQATPIDTVPIPVSANWRLIATLNDQDQDLLFALSEALQRRFAVIDMHVPTPQEWGAILAASGGTGNAQLTAAIQALVAGPAFNQRPLGAAVVLDAVRHLRKLRSLADEGVAVGPDHVLLDQALDLYIRPHLRSAAGDVIAVDAQALLQGPQPQQPAPGTPAATPQTDQPTVPTTVPAPAPPTT